MPKLILIAGPSGAGKTTISAYLTKKFHIPRVVTHTTRPMRDDERANESYYFESDASFAKLHFFEHIHYGSYQYGSSREALRRVWEKHELVSLIVDIQGARSYLAQLQDQICFIYVTVSARSTLEQRLLERGDNPAKIANRLSGAELNELPADLMTRAKVIRNDNWEKTKMQLDRIVADLQE
mgnify:CR=1 FL=1